MPYVVFPSFTFVHSYDSFGLFYSILYFIKKRKYVKGYRSKVFCFQFAPYRSIRFTLFTIVRKYQQKFLLPYHHVRYEIIFQFHSSLVITQFHIIFVTLSLTAFPSNGSLPRHIVTLFFVSRSFITLSLSSFHSLGESQTRWKEKKKYNYPYLIRLAVFRI